jgi:protein TonB
VTPPRSDAGYLNNPKPVYPLAAKRRGEEGTAYVKLMVTADGRAKDVVLGQTSGSPALDEAAVAAVRLWRFVPARQGTQTIEAPYLVPVVFKLE